MKLSVNQTKNTEKDLISFGITKLRNIFAHDMRKLLFIMALALGCLKLQAQENKETGFGKSEDYDMTVSHYQTPAATLVGAEEVRPMATCDYIDLADSLSYRRNNLWGPWSGAGVWNLHSGLNVSLGASVFSPIGKKSHGGAGFAQNITAVYVVPLTNKLSLAVGGYFDNVNWGHRSYRDAGLNAVLGYRFNEHWEAYVYGQKSFLKKEMPLPLYYMTNVGDRIGAAVRYSPNHTFSVTVSVEGRSEPAWVPSYPFGGSISDFPYRGMDW